MPGVEILLIPGTRIPRWISVQDKNVTVIRKILNGQDVRSLRLKRGDAAFMPGGGIGVLVPYSSWHAMAFREDKVLEIRTLGGKLLKRNYYMCKQCVRVSGKIQGKQKLSERAAGKLETDFKCTNCGHGWQLLV